MPNRLAGERSPYLLQHADNPVNWYPWGREAFERAQQEDKPILVSIGYSACHWCHVMERESFEDEVTARLMNDRFVNVKVDREERPDVDAIYMDAVQLLTRQGGWPLNVFLTPDGKPFYGGTYFPPRPGHGMPSWPQILEMVSTAYRERRDDVAHNASTLTDYIRQAQHIGRSEDTITPDLLRDAYAEITRQLDWGAGGFGSAPKFPQPLGLELVLRMSHRFEDERGREFVELTLRNMAAGGIFDQLGGGFHRYTVDGLWVVPHFEKMLYDNALLARVYLQAFQTTHHPFYRSIVERTLDYLLRDMQSPEGGFFSAEDADSEGVEGKYYVWTPEDLARSLTQDEAEIAGMRYGIRPHGNFEGRTILTVQMPISEIAERTGNQAEEVEESLRSASEKLLEARSRRVPPGKDTKILCSWNALAIRALAEAGRALERDDYLQAAGRAAAFLLDGLRPNGRLVRSYRGGPSDIPGFLEDYAYLAEALLALYQTSFDSTYLSQAQLMLQEMIDRFWDADQAAFFDVAADTPDLIVRPRNLYDNPIPSGTSAATMALLLYQALTGDSTYEPQVLSAFHATRDLLVRAPLGFAALLSALDFYLSPQIQVAILGDSDEMETSRMVRAVFDRYLPNAVIAVGDVGRSPLLEGRRRVDGRPTAFVCEHFTCQLPVTSAEELAGQLDELRR